jgi:arylsulfatase A-like enzyme
MRAAAATAILLLGLAPGCAPATPARRAPNIVLIVWDTCRADRVTVNGCPRPTTPRLEAFAREAAVFRNCFTASPWTPPSHASLFTGLLPRNHGLREGVGDRVREGLPLLAETLRAGGYEAACVAANPQISPATGLDAGFDPAIRCWSEGAWKGEGVEVVRRLREWLPLRKAKGSGKPLFLFVNLMESHLPSTFDIAALAAVHGDGAVNRARRAATLVTDERTGFHLHGEDPVDAGTIEDLGLAYDGAVRTMDGFTGEILDLLRKDGILEGAVVAVCGDHGENLGEHGDLNHLLSVHDPVLHVPLVLRWPGRFEGGRVVDEQVRLHDLYPTLLEAAGLPVPPACGRDAASLSETPLRSRVVVSEYGPADALLAKAARLIPTTPPAAYARERDALVSVREPGDRPAARKFISIRRKGGDGVAPLLREELYDIAADPGELRDLLERGGAPGERAAADRLRSAAATGK